MSYIHWLHRGKLERSVAGGKGASLSELIAGGFVVPAGFCVTAEGYRRFAAAADLQGDAATVAARVEAAPLPDDLRDQISDAYAELSAMGGLACAVRSSAVSEDGSSASFAGLYESYLNVVGLADVLTSVRRCYASLWSVRAQQYRSSHGASDGEAMAVVIMSLVPSEVSGVAFTAHPVTGARDQVVINASWGLGEAIVSGRVTPDCFVVHKPTGRLLEREIFTKDVAIYPHPDGDGTLERRLAPEQARAPCLSDELARDVAGVAARVESYYGSPQDIEWGIAGGGLFLLQSRPITTLG
jgi:pyruvate,water dikinase